jgi:hypothetical protein
MTKVVIIGEIEVGGEKHPAVLSGDITYGEGPPPVGLMTKAPQATPQPPIEPIEETTETTEAVDTIEHSRGHRRR